jgi:hypothetical protein
VGVDGDGVIDVMADSTKLRAQGVVDVGTNPDGDMALRLRDSV